MACILLKRSLAASVLALALAAASLGGLAPLLVPVALAQDQSPEQHFQALLDMQGVPAGILKWSGVEATPGGLIVHGLYVDTESYKVGFDTLPLGDLELTDIQIQDNKYVTHLKAKFTDITIDSEKLMATGQRMGQVPPAAPGAANVSAQMGMGIAMLSGYIQGLGYKTLTVTLGFEEAIDLASAKAVVTAEADIANAFKLDVGYDLIGVDAAYLDWAKAYAAKMYLDHSPAASADIQKQMSDPASPIGKVGFSRYGVEFADQGLMQKLEPQLAPVRAQLLGRNPDGTLKTEVSDEEVKKTAASWAASRKMTAEKVEPLVRAVYNFFVKTPAHIAVTIKLYPPFTLGELYSMKSPVPGAPAPAIDWNSRLTIDASN